MDPCPPDDNTEPDSLVASLINQYFDRRRSGEELTPESFAAEHPDLAEKLRPYLEGLRLLDKIRPSEGTAPGVLDALCQGLAPSDALELPTIEGYQLRAEIGRGGMGVVYEALQISTKRVVALKVMLVGPFASKSALRRFDREVELAARLQHPGIVRVLESGQVAGRKYFAMDYIEGIRLDRHLARVQADVRTTLAIVERICEAVDYAHHHGVIHRDLKPANVLIDDEANPHILDFGLAKAIDDADTEEALTTCVSSPGQVMGTLFYLAPEQAAGVPDEIDARTDVYTLGVMLFEALTNSLPFDVTGRPSQVIQRILETPPTLPSSASNRVDSELETIILKAMEKEKGRRYQSAKEMGEDIRRYLEGEPILAKRLSSFYVLRKKVLKHRVAAALAVVAVAIGVIGLLGGIRAKRHDLAAARRDALTVQRGVETGAAAQQLGSGQMLYAQHRNLPEARLVWAQAQFRNETTRASGILFLERELQGAPSRWACRALLADMYRTTGDNERAGALQARSEREAPDTAEACYLRSFATLDPQHALRSAEEAVKRDPSHVLAWCRLTWLRKQTGDLDGALKGADRVVKLGQDPGEWGLFKGHVLARKGRFRQAIDQYTRVTTIEPKIRSAFLYRAHAYRRVQEYAKAIADYTKMLDAEADTTVDAWHLYQRATPLWILGRTDEALEDYRRVRIRLGRPFYSDARRFLILLEQGRPREAEGVLAAALRDVRDPWLRKIFACLSGQLAPDELVAAAETRSDPEQLCEAYYYAGEVCLLSNDFPEARTWFERCVQTGVEFDLDTGALTPMNEYELALWRLESLPAGPSTSHPEKE